MWTTYLGMQQVSDSVHRWVIILVPVCTMAAGVLFFAQTHINRYVRQYVRIVATIAIIFGVGVIFFVFLFDITLEHRGLAGDLEVKTPRVQLMNVANTLETYNKKVVGELIVYTGPSELDYDDDVVVVALDKEAGKEEWRVHQLGTSISSVSVDQTQLAYTTCRQVTSALHLLDWTKPALVWALRVKGKCTLEPRFQNNTIEIIVDGKLWKVERKHPRVLQRIDNACTHAQDLKVACENGRVKGWITRR